MRNDSTTSPNSGSTSAAPVTEIVPVYYFLGKRRKLDGYRLTVDGIFINVFATEMEAETAAREYRYNAAAR